MRACQSHLSMRWRCDSSGFGAELGARLASMARRSRPLFRIVLELLLERCKLGERRIRIRLLARARACTRLGEVHGALGGIDPLAGPFTAPARPVAAAIA